MTGSYKKQFLLKKYFIGSVECATMGKCKNQMCIRDSGSYVFGIIVMMIIRANTMEENECVTLGMLIAMAALVFVHFFGIRCV